MSWQSLLAVVFALAASSAHTQSLTPQADQADIGILVFSAYGCGYCAQTADTLELLRLRHANRVAIQIKHFPLGEDADELWAHRAAFAFGQQGMLSQMHPLLFKKALSAAGRADVRKHFEVLGGNLGDFDLAIDDAAAVRTIADDQREAKALGVRVAPTVFLDGFKLEGLQAISIYEDLIKFHLERSDTVAQTEGSSKLVAQRAGDANIRGGEGRPK